MRAPTIPDLKDDRQAKMELMRIPIGDLREIRPTSHKRQFNLMQIMEVALSAPTAPAMGLQERRRIPARRNIWRKTAAARAWDMGMELRGEVVRRTRWGPRRGKRRSGSPQMLHRKETAQLPRLHGARKGGALTGRPPIRRSARGMYPTKRRIWFGIISSGIPNSEFQGLVACVAALRWASSICAAWTARCSRG